MRHKQRIMLASNTNDEQDRTRGWSKLEQPMPFGARVGHRCCAIDDHRMIFVDGKDNVDAGTTRYSSSCAIYDAKANVGWEFLPNDVPALLSEYNVLAYGPYVYVIGGKDYNCDTTCISGKAVNTVHRLSLKTYEWTIMMPMGTARYGCVAVVYKGVYIYVFGGKNGRQTLCSSERYCIGTNTWEALSADNKVVKRFGHAFTVCSDIYIVGGGFGDRSLEVFDTVLQRWKIEEALMPDMPGSKRRKSPAAVLLKDRFLVVIGGWERRPVANCLIYDCIMNQWSSAPESVDMTIARVTHSIAVLGGTIFVAGGRGMDREPLSSMEFIDADDLLKHAVPLIRPLPIFCFNRILELGRANDDNKDGDGIHDDGFSSTVVLRENV